ncbi:MAG: DUF1501 domain-containing protein [Rhodospirillaceae bacterium]|nr:DUF1501 domain-containing protein [Rhodospirillaceae bacterium]
MPWSRRTLMKAAAGAVTALGGAAYARPNVESKSVSGFRAVDFRAVVGVFLFGGHDGWNMAVPLDARYEAYRAARGARLALPRHALLPLADTAFGLHTAFAPLHDLAGGALGLVLNTGALTQPLTKALYQQRPDLRPTNVMLHAEAEAHWGRDAEIVTTLARFNAATAGALFTVQETPSAPAQALQVDRNFKHLTTDVAAQFHRAARRIEAREAFGHHHQAFLVSQCGYDTHEDQMVRQAALYADLAAALAAFQSAMIGLGLEDNVTTFTMSEFGRSYKANWDGGTEHAWGNNHLVVGGAATQAVRGLYPRPVLSGPDDVVGDGRWLPSMSIEQYLAPIARWYGVTENDLPRVFPNWATWNTAASA